MLIVADWNERLAQMEFLLKEEECKRVDTEEKYQLLQHEMIQQAIEMDEKMAEMERTYMYRLLEQVPPYTPTPFSPAASQTFARMLIIESSVVRPR